MDPGLVRITHNTPPMVISQIISRILEKLLNYTENMENSPEFKFLRDKSVYGNDSVDLIASQALLLLVEYNKITTKALLPEITTLFTTTKCNSNITFLINNLLVFDLHKELSQNISYKSSFNLLLPQHPFITLLKEDPDRYCASIYQEIVNIYETADDEELNFDKHLDQLYKPVLLYTLCNSHDAKLVVFKEKLWTFYLESYKSRETDGSMLRFLLSWMQFEGQEVLKENSELLTKLDLEHFERDEVIDDDFVLMLKMSALYRLIINNFNPNPILYNIVIYKPFHGEEPSAVTVPAILIITKILYVCSPVHLKKILHICNDLIKSDRLDVITQHALIAALLQWTGNPSYLTKGLTIKCQEILSKMKNINNTDLKSAQNKHFLIVFEMENCDLINSHDDVYIAVQLALLLGNLNSTECLAKWIVKLKEAPDFFLHKISNFLFGIYLIPFEDEQIELDVQELVLKIISYDAKLKSYVITLILHKLTSARHPEMHYKLMKTMCFMGQSQECVPKIVSTFRAIAQGSSVLYNLSSALMMNLWKVNTNCYAYLEKFIITPYDASKGNKWEFYASRAQILKEICAFKPELHGKEMVPHLSKILNECNQPEGALAASLALDGITLLCKSDIIDAITTWNTLAPMLKTDTRLNVVKSVCSFIKEIPSLSYTENLHEEVVKKLWDYIASTTEEEIWKSALDSMACYNLETILENMPEVYLTEEMLNLKASGQKLPHDCWIFFLNNCPKSNMPLVGDFFIKLVEREISKFLKFVYHVKDAREPTEYSFLAPNSVLRCLTSYIRHNAHKWKGSICAEIFTECLRVLSAKYSKPLPPFDWCFLQEFIHEPKTRYYVLDITSHQVVISGTARRLIVSFVEAITVEKTENEKDIKNIYNNLHYLAKSVQPFTLSPFLKHTMLYAVEMHEKSTLLEEIVKCSKLTLEDPDIHEANKSVIAKIITEIITNYDVDSAIFEIFLDCVVLFPKSHLDGLTAPKVVKEMSDEWFKKAIRISCFHAARQKTGVFAILNGIIEFGYLFPSLKKYLYEQFSKVFIKQSNSSESILWLFDFIGEIHTMTVEKSETKSIAFHCDVFILAVVIFSGHYTFLNKLTNQSKLNAVFPRAVATLFDVNQWNICTNQALEWFYVMCTQNILNDDYKNIFKKCLQSLRHDDEFNKNMKWIKYLNVNK